MAQQQERTPALTHSKMGDTVVSGDLRSKSTVKTKFGDKTVYNIGGTEIFGTANLNQILEKKPIGTEIKVSANGKNEQGYALWKVEENN